ncbi:ADI_G0005330.mRNA.1.CDS.1 [Saccharomyces cerevisiae]|nr:ADI_G0005330.mRNA.1.CDS.1 [Saccharomyces cerevisiae]CAI6516385.1 ADI_G0005330.mRNA.1.CDS.1 [Saccharomyces cerevisiae]
MMPAKLQLDILRTLQSSACHGTQTLKNFQFLERLYNDRIVFCLPFFLALFSSQFKKYCSTSVFDSRKLLHTLKYNSLICLPDMRKTRLPCLPSCRIQYTNCFSSSSNSQVPSIISLYPRVDLSPFYAKIFQISYRVPMIWLDVFQVFFVFLVISQHSLHS